MAAEIARRFVVVKRSIRILKRPGLVSPEPKFLGYLEIVHYSISEYGFQRQFLALSGHLISMQMQDLTLII